jgi:hypothetical protein
LIGLSLLFKYIELGILTDDRVLKCKTSPVDVPIIMDVPSKLSFISVTLNLEAFPSTNYLLK